jgi:hypothetical protein
MIICYFDISITTRPSKPAQLFKCSTYPVSRPVLAAVLKQLLTCLAMLSLKLTKFNNPPKNYPDIISRWAQSYKQKFSYLRKS